MSTKRSTPANKAGQSANGRFSNFLKICDSSIAEVIQLGLPKLSNDYTHMSYDSAQNALIGHRIQSKYEVPSNANSATRKVSSINKVLESDAKQPIEFNWRTLQPHHRKSFLTSQEWLRNFFMGFKHSYKLRFPTGETFVGVNGLTDLIFKLRDLNQWLISPDCVDYAVEILLRNRSLLAVVKQRYKEKYGKRGHEVLIKLRASGALVYDNNALRRQMVRFYLRATTVFCRSSRVTTVPKNNSEDRVITCEPLWNMICQLSYGASLRAQLKLKCGIDLDSTQQVHRALIRSGKATIDLSKASDSNLMCVLRALWPAKQYKTLESLRSGLFELEGGEYVPLRMFAPMGCGCTFEVMTLTLLAHTRVFDSGSSVFGDDIIIESAYANQLIDFLEVQNWVINERKSFLDGNFRESCGAFCHVGLNKFYYSYDLPRPTDLTGCFVFLHKLLRISSCATGDLRRVLLKAYARLVLLMPRDSFMAIDNRALDFSLPLSEYIVYVPAEWLGSLSTSTSSRVTRCLETFWQRPIQLTHRQQKRLTRQVVSKDADATLVAAFLRRGTSYDPIVSTKGYEHSIVERWTGTPLRGILMASVI